MENRKWKMEGRSKNIKRNKNLKDLNNLNKK
jgi:hypothetical protein